MFGIARNAGAFAVRRGAIMGARYSHTAVRSGANSVKVGAAVCVLSALAGAGEEIGNQIALKASGKPTGVASLE